MYGSVANRLWEVIFPQSLVCVVQEIIDHRSDGCPQAGLHKQKQQKHRKIKDSISEAKCFMIKNSLEIQSFKRVANYGC